jgi:putative mycofactocin binding protein MftB
MTSEEAGTSGDAGTSVDAGASRAPFDPARPYEKHPQVAIRPESFGALAYHYGHRRLVFLKAPALVTVVETLGDFPSAAAAVAAHVPDAQRQTYTRALSGLLTSDVIRARLLARGGRPSVPGQMANMILGCGPWL